MEKEEFINLIDKYIEYSSHVDSISTFIGKIFELTSEPSVREQFFALSTISNYHWIGYPSTHPPHKIINPRVSYQSHILTGTNKKYNPTSPRNRVMHFVKNGENDILETYV